MATEPKRTVDFVPKDSQVSAVQEEAFREIYKTAMDRVAKLEVENARVKEKYEKYKKMYKDVVAAETKRVRGLKDQTQYVNMELECPTVIHPVAEVQTDFIVNVVIPPWSALDFEPSSALESAQFTCTKEDNDEWYEHLQRLKD